MDARFEFEYDGKGTTSVKVDVVSDIVDNEDKKDFLFAVADILGVTIVVQETYEEEVFKDED